MKKNFIKHYTLGALTLAAFALTACMNDPAPGSDEFGTLAVTVNTRDVSAGALAKGSAISYKALYVTLTSNATPADTVRDTILPGTYGFTATATSNQTVSKSYTLAALRTWKITVETADLKDSTIHSTTDSIVKLLAGSIVSRNLTLAPRFVMYKANFNFPDSISSKTGPDKQKMNVTRLIMKVDGITVVDSSANFAPNAAHSIGYDYVPVNQGTTVELSVIGNLEGWSYAGDSTLYRDTTIAISGLSPSIDGNQSVTLPYVGPVTGKADLSISIQKVGLYQMNITTEPDPVPKSSK